MLVQVVAFTCLSLFGSIAAFRIRTPRESASTGTVVYLANSDDNNGEPFHAGYKGGAYRYTQPDTFVPRPSSRMPQWTRMTIGCEDRFNQGFCQVALFQHACVARHGELQGIKMSAANACQQLLPGAMDSEPRHMYCMAAASDPGLAHLVTKDLVKKAPENPWKCSVAHLSHLQGERPGEAADNLKFATTQTLFGKDVHPEFGYAVWKSCSNYLPLASAVLEKTSNSSMAYQFGFCHAGNGERLAISGKKHKWRRDGQDCEFLWGIRAAWGRESKYGKEYCGTFQPEPAALRCLAVRKQLIQIAKSKSKFNTARWTAFDDLVRISKESCPEPPSGTPDEPDLEDGIADAELVDELE